MAKSDTYTFNPASRSRSRYIIQPRLANIKLTETDIFDKGEPIGTATREKFEKLGGRNERQQTAIKALPKEEIRTLDGTHNLLPQAGQLSNPASDTQSNLTVMFSPPLDWSYRCYEVTRAGERPIIRNGKRQPIEGFQTHIYLFNVIVGFEWEPSLYDLKEIERAAWRAADFLFDVTDGWMTFGQVVIGGPMLLSCADIQVLASNRLHPRVWVGGLHESDKYVPIRLGRGLWQKNNRVSIPWDEPEGYRILIHEWGHYALELIDGYLETHQVYIPGDVKSAQGPNEARRSNRELVISSISQPVESIMARLEGTSELVPKRDLDPVDGKFQEWKNIIDGYLDYKPRFPRIKEQPTPIEGPLPLRELPNVVRFQPTIGPTAKSTDITEVLLFDIPPSVNPEHCWVYVLKYDGDAVSRIIAQGTFDDRLRNGFRLLGAEINDEIVLIGDTSKYKPIVQRGTITKLKPILTKEEGNQLTQKDDRDDYIIGEGWRPLPGEGTLYPRRTGAYVGEWEEWTPTPFPLIDVLPATLDKHSTSAAIQVRVIRKIGGILELDSLPKIQFFPLGHPDTAGAELSPITPDMDQDTFLSPAAVSLDGHVLVEWPDRKDLAIATFSQGGGPPTGSPVNGAPITAGSADGNLMIFFESRGETVYKRGDHAEVRVITTRQPGLEPDLYPVNGLGAEPRGYAFSLGSNGPLPLEHKPTLVISYDKQTELDDGEPVVHRMDATGTWQPVPTYRPRGAWYVAAPLNEDTAPNLTKAVIDKNKEVRVERFRIFLVRRQPAQDTAAATPNPIP
jgi:hypothetical protein